MNLMDNNETLRLQLYLSRCGIGSRRKCEEFIQDGRVAVNGEIVLKLGTKVSYEDEIYFDGKKIRPVKEHVYLILHKPAGYICSTKDPSGRPLVYDLLKPVIEKRIFYIGRLDYMSSGLLIFTDDGDFAQMIQRPAAKIEKEYVVTTAKEIPKELMDNFMKGLRIQGEFFRLKSYDFMGPRKVKIILEEGKNRELRKVFQSQNIRLKKIHRVRIGPIKLYKLPPGHFRYLKDNEIAMLKKAVGIKGGKK